MMAYAVMAFLLFCTSVAARGSILSHALTRMTASFAAGAIWRTSVQSLP